MHRVVKHAKFVNLRPQVELKVVKSLGSTEKGSRKRPRYAYPQAAVRLLWLTCCVTVGCYYRPPLPQHFLLQVSLFLNSLSRRDGAAGRSLPLVSPVRESI